MNKLYDTIITNYNLSKDINNLDLTINKFDINNHIIDIHNLYNKTSYIGKEYVKLRKHIIYNIKINKIEIIINFYTYENINQDIINRSIIRIKTMINVFYNKIKTTKIIFQLFLYYAPRLITAQYNNNPNEFENFNKLSLFNCVNGWFSETDKFSTIVVTRLNNCLGLLTHELCHLCCLDFGKYDTFEQWDIYYKQYISNNSGYFVEGINNAISTIIHAIFLNLENNNNYNYLYDEIKHSYKLCQNIVKYFKCDTLQELLNKKIYNQNSQVFEYIILRYIYLKYLDSLFHLKYVNNEFIEKYTINKYYKLFINFLEKELNNIKANKLNNKFESMEYYKHEL